MFVIGCCMLLLSAACYLMSQTAAEQSENHLSDAVCKAAVPQCNRHMRIAAMPQCYTTHAQQRQCRNTAQSGNAAVLYMGHMHNSGNAATQPDYQ
jgi:hypothetical protein